ncbi:MAG: DUF4097 family beta strand repeat-containing protein [Thermoanaerobaculia bacterium]
MSRHTIAAAPASRRAPTAQARALWIVLGTGLLLMLAAAASADPAGFAASRTDRFDATLPAGTTVHVANVNGDIVASGSRAFSAVVTTTVTASSQARAEEILGRTAISSSSRDGEYRLETRWPGAGGPRSRDRRRAALACRDCRIVSRYEITLPSGVGVELQTVNGEVRVRDVDGDLELRNVNGNIEVLGARRALDAQTVNGKVEAVAASLPAGSSWELQTVNGAVVATLPKDARFDWSASTMSGRIASSFALPPGREEAAAQAPPAPPRARTPGPARAPRVVVAAEGEEGEILIDAEALAREIEESLREVELEVRESLRWTEKEAGKAMRQVRVTLPERRYAARVGGGGATVRASTLNGNITLLAAGTRESDARPLLSGRRAIVVTIPDLDMRLPGVRVRVPRIRVEPAPHADPDPDPDPMAHEEEEVVRGDISGDFLSTSNASYRLGRVSGTVKILTHSGEIHVASAGNGAEIKTYGGDIRLGPVRGDLRAQTFAGDVRAVEVTGSAAAETSGGDIRIERVAGAATARTGGGDIVLPAVGGGIQAETGGGEVRIGVVSRRVSGGITIRNAGGDVVLTLPSDFQADLDLAVDGPFNPEDVLIRSDFAGVAVTRSAASQRASGSLNGGGPRVTVRTTSGSIRLRRAPAAGS